MRVIFAMVALTGLLIDQLAKIVAVRLLDPHDPPVLLGGLLTLRLIRNPGAAFSMGEGFTIVFAVLAIGVLAYVLIKLAPKINHPGWAVALGLLVAGVSGNLMDRVFREPSFLHGHVVDFFQLPHFAIFNVADVCITSAAVLIMILAIVKNVGIDGTHYVRTPPEANDASPAATGEGADTAVDAGPDPDESVERPDRER
jgi:signal peptidase II